MRRALYGAVLAVCVALGCILLRSTNASATGSAPVGDAGEAWYDTSLAKACSSPVGCPPVTLPGNKYPANTLHVGVGLGSTTAVTYLLPDLSAYLGSGLPSTGTMILPLATVSGNGNSNASTAVIEACLSKAGFPNGTQGSTSAPPPTDCSVHADLKYAGKSFTLDLSPFLGAWQNGAAPYGIALMPASVGATTSWHVAFNGRRLAGAPHVESSFGPAASPGFASFPAPSSGSPAPFPSPSPAASASIAPPPAQTGSAGTPASSPALATPPPASQSTSPVTRSPGQTSILAASHGFQYPEIMLLPLLIGGGALFLIRILTSDATPRKFGTSPKPRTNT